jgi:benzylsuccinate CoA-transferase BbsF subunit
LNVLEFCWGAVGPFTGRYLADHGATVLRVESVSRPDFLRTYVLTRDPQILETNTFFALANANKRSLALNLKRPDGVALVKRLVAEWADVVIENFAPGALERMGLGYEVLREIKPDLVMLSTAIMGQTGPWRSYSGFGSQGSAYAGFTHLCGWPDKEPVGTAGTITDSLAPRFCGFALVAALDYRRRTGRGTHIDLSQTEAAAVALGPALLDYAFNGRLMQRQGNRRADMAPHGIFPCVGQNRWIAIGCRDDADWLALRRAMGEPAWAARPALDSLPGRKAAEDEIEAAIGAWTAPQEQYALMAALQEAGVPAGVVSDAAALGADPQLAHREQLWRAEHAYLGQYPVVGPQHILSGGPPVRENAGPLLGEANEWVCGEILGLPAEVVARLYAEGVLEKP